MEIKIDSSSSKGNRYLLDVDEYELYLIHSALMTTILHPSSPSSSPSFSRLVHQKKSVLLSDMFFLLRLLKHRSINDNDND